MFLLTLLGGVTAWADFSETWTESPVGPWSEFTGTLPTGITASGTPYAYSQVVFNRTAGNKTISFNYTSGNHGLRILGVDLVNAEGTVVVSHYETKNEGNNGADVYSTYTLQNVPVGNYTLRYFVGSVTNQNEVTKTNGNITVTGLEQGKFISSVSELRNDKVYVIKSGRTTASNTYYLLSNGKTSNYLLSNYQSGVTELTYSKASTNFHFAIQKVGENYYFYNMAAEKFVGNSSENNGEIPLVDFQTNDMEIRDCSSESADYCFKLSTNGTGALNAANFPGCRYGVVNWSGGYNADDAGNRYQIIEIGDLSSENQTLIQNKINYADDYYKVNSFCANTSFTTIGAFTPSSCFNLSSYNTSFLFSPTEANYNTMMTEYNNVINNENNRVTLSKGEKFTVKCIDTSRGYLVYSTVENKGSEANAYLAGAASGYSSWIPGLDDEGVYKEWAIYSHEDLKYLYNVQKQQFIKPTTPVQFCDDSHPIVLEQVAGSYTQWKIKFTENNNYLGFSPGYNTGEIVRSQTSTDNGNIFIIEKVTNESETVQSVSEEFQTAMASKVLPSQITSLLRFANLVGTGVGKYTYSGELNVANTITTAENLTAEATPTVTEMEACVTNLLDIQRNATINQPETRKLYRFRCVGNTNGKRLISDLNSSSNMTTGDVNGNLQSSIFYLTEDNKILSFATGLYVGKYNGSRLQMFEAGSSGVAASFADVFSVYGRYPGAYSIRVNNRNIYGAGDEMDSGSTTEDRDGYFWTIEEVKWLPISVTNGYSKLGTFVSPVPLKAASAGNYAKGGRLKFYTGTIETDSYFHVTEFTEDVIPAGVPFLIEYQDGSPYENSCSYLEVSSIEGNTFSDPNGLQGGFATVRTPEDKGTIYTLQKTGSDPATAKQEFWQYTGTNVKGFRAYLPVPAGTLVRGMIFGGTTTDIEGATTEETAAPVIYDLSGRRVQHAAKGMYIVNGKKMYVK